MGVSIDFTDVTLVSDDTYRRLYWCDPDYPDDPDESYLVMKQSKYFGPKFVGPKAYLAIASSKLCNFLDVKTLSGRDRAFVGELADVV